LLPPANDDEGQGVPVHVFDGENGAQAAYLLLRELGYRSERWEKSPTDFPRCGRQILILARPFQFPGQSERDALLRFARNPAAGLFTRAISRFSFSKPARLQPALSRISSRNR
jgi:hypothetical protein